MWSFLQLHIGDGVAVWKSRSVGSSTSALEEVITTSSSAEVEDDHDVLVSAVELQVTSAGELMR